MKNIIVFGVSNLYNLVKSKLQIYNIVGMFDNDAEKQGKIIDNITVDIPQNINKYNFDYVIITSIFYSDIIKQLKQLNIPYEKIYVINQNGYYLNRILLNNLKTIIQPNNEMDWFLNVKKIEDIEEYIHNYVQNKYENNINILEYSNESTILTEYLNMKYLENGEKKIHIFTKKDLKNKIKELYKINLIIFSQTNETKEEVLYLIRKLESLYSYTTICAILKKNIEIEKYIDKNKIKKISNEFSSNEYICITINDNCNI